jgi:hypothetical protein
LRAITACLTSVSESNRNYTKCPRSPDKCKIEGMIMDRIRTHNTKGRTNDQNKDKTSTISSKELDVHHINKVKNIRADKDEEAICPQNN